MTEEQIKICEKCKLDFELEHEHSNFHCPFVNKMSCKKYNPNYKAKEKICYKCKNFFNCPFKDLIQKKEKCPDYEKAD